MSKQKSLSKKFYFFKILIEYLDKIAPEKNDPLREIFSLLNHEPNLDSLTDNLCTKVSTNSHTPSDTITRNNFSKNTQICLTLTNRFTPNGDEKTDANNLFIKTKRYIVEIINCQPGENLRQILKTPATVEQVGNMTFIRIYYIRIHTKKTNLH